MSVFLRRTEAKSLLLEPCRVEVETPSSANSEGHLRTCDGPECSTTVTKTSIVKGNLATTWAHRCTTIRAERQRSPTLTAPARPTPHLPSPSLAPTASAPTPFPDSLAGSCFGYNCVRVASAATPR